MSTNADPTDDAHELIGTRLGNYVLHEVIGRGGMGVVYRAEHVYIHKPAAVKVLRGRYFDNDEARHRFLHEAQAASVIDHPNIVGVNDFGEAPDGTVFLVMAHVEGTGLDRLLRHERHLPLFRTLGILNQVTRALAAAHERGIVHRDLKPENIMLANRPGRRELVRAIRDPRGHVSEITEMEGMYDFVTILDFGAAKFWHQSTSEAHSGGSVVGTPTYMAPETARSGVADARSDIYSVGVIFYEMLTGSVPFDAETAVEIMVKHVSEPVQPPRLRNPRVEISPQAERLILKALAKDPRQRHATMDELNADLHGCYGSVRFRRPLDQPVAGPGFEAMRKPIPLTPDKMKRRMTGEVPSTSAPTRPTPVSSPAVGKHPSGSGPVLLTKRKSGKHPTLPMGLPILDPDDDPSKK